MISNDIKKKIEILFSEKKYQELIDFADKHKLKIGKIEVTKILLICEFGKKTNINQNGKTPKLTQK